MGWRQDRAVPNWPGTVSAIKECLEAVLMGIELGEREGLRPEIIALDSLDELDSFLSSLKRDLGV